MGIPTPEGPMAVDGKALAVTVIGGVFVWSGIRGWSILGTIGDLVAGKKPQQTITLGRSLTVPTAEAPPGQATRPGESAVKDLAQVAMQYQGHAYQFGGAPGRNGENPWDCSSFCNYCVGVKLGRPIPGLGAGRYDGTFHGPATGNWGVWSGLTRIKRADVQAGDIIVWLRHMGIAIDNSHMISALNRSEGTKVTPIEGHGNGPIVAYGRI